MTARVPAVPMMVDATPSAATSVIVEPHSQVRHRDEWGTSPPLVVKRLIPAARVHHARPGPARRHSAFSALPHSAQTMKEAMT